MSELQDHIGELLFSYDCVVIPGFGGFVCSFNPATIHPVRHSFSPPSKKISFNKMLVMNDGLLAHHLSLRQGISYQHAIESINEVTAEWNNSLKMGRAVELKNIGKLFLDGVGNLQFHFESSENYLIESFGLNSFHSLPVDRKPVMRVLTDAAENADRIPTLPSITRMAKYSVAAAILSVAVLTVYKAQVFPSLQKAAISLNPFGNEIHTYNERRYPEFMENGAVSESRDIKKNDLAAYDAGIANLPPFGIRDEVPVVSSLIPTGPYHVVAGCFSINENAKRLQEKLISMGYAANASVRQGSLLVVSYGSFESRESALELLRLVKEKDNSDAWLLVKR